MIVKRRYVKVTAAPLGLFGDPKRYEVMPMFEGMAPELWELQEVETGGDSVDFEDLDALPTGLNWEDTIEGEEEGA